MKKTLAVTLVLTLCLSVAFIAMAETSDPVTTLTEGRWVYSFPVDGLGDFGYYFHFYKDVPGYDNVYYAGFALNQLNFAGTWAVEKADYEYAVYMDREDEEPVTGTAPYTIIFSDWNGNPVESCGYDGEFLYNDMDVIYGMYSGPAIYTHDTDVEGGKFASLYSEEKDMPIMSFVSEEDPTCTMTIYHNGRYMDLVNMMVEGNWAMETLEDGSRVYTLTPDEDYDTPAVFTVTADSSTAHYANDDGDEMDMSAVATGPAVAYTMLGSFTFMEGVDATMTLALYEDGTCILEADVFGNVAVLDRGAWTMAEDGYTIDFVFTAADVGEVSTTLNPETYAVELAYTQAGTELGDVDVTLTMVVE